jgi:hypothetical protein
VSSGKSQEWALDIHLVVTHKLFSRFSIEVLSQLIPEQTINAHVSIRNIAGRLSDHDPVRAQSTLSLHHAQHHAPQSLLPKLFH